MRVAAALLLVAVPAAAESYGVEWKALVTGSECPASTAVASKDGGAAAQIRCERRLGSRHFFFPAGQFDIDEQVLVPAGTTIEGSANPNDPSDKTRKPDPAAQTFFVATKGVHDFNANYCGTKNNLRQGDAQKLRIGFLLLSNTVVKNINFQGKDTVRPKDNGSLCGGAAFETPGCVSPGFSNGDGKGWVGRHGCRDVYGGSNELVTGDGRGVHNVVIENVRLNDLLPGTQGSQIAVWVAQTRDGSATRNVRVTNLVSMQTIADGINFHGNVQDSIVEYSHLENTGDDIFAVWGGYYHPAGIVFRHNVGRNAGSTRSHFYGVCIAVYGAKDVVFEDMTCYDPPENRASCFVPHMCNSCMLYVHDGWFGAVYPHGNRVTLRDSLYLDMSGNPITDRNAVRTDSGSDAVVVANAAEFLP